MLWTHFSVLFLMKLLFGFCLDFLFPKILDNRREWKLPKKNMATLYFILHARQQLCCYWQQMSWATYTQKLKWPLVSSASAGHPGHCQKAFSSSQQALNPFHHKCCSSVTVTEYHSLELQAKTKKAILQCKIIVMHVVHVFDVWERGQL